MVSNSANNDNSANRHNHERVYKNRSSRIVSPIGKQGGVVRYLSSGSSTYKLAQLADVSQTGARFISRAPLRASIGDFLNIEVSLAGTDRKIKTQARIVRRVNDFVFAVRFIGVTDESRNHIDNTLNEHQTFLQSLSRSAMFIWALDIKWWFKEHRRGLYFFAYALVVAAAIGTMIYFHSDERLGLALRSWGKEIPRSWYWDYIKHFHK